MKLCKAFTVLWT